MKQFLPSSPTIYRFFFLTMMLAFSTSSYSQITKVWELNTPGNHQYPPSYDINSRPYLRSFPTSNGEFIVVSLKNASDTVISRTIYLFRHDAEGNIVWEYMHPSPHGIEETIKDVAVDVSGNMIIAGKTTTGWFDPIEPIESSNTLLLKISPQGQLIWARESNPAPIRGVQNSTGITTDAEGNIYTVSILIDADGGNPLLQKRSAEGLLIWERTLSKNFYDANVEKIDSILFILRAGNPSTIFHYSLDGQFLFEGDGPKITGLKPVFDQQGNWYNFSHVGDFEIQKFDIYGDMVWNYHKESNLPSNIFADELTDCFIDTDENVYITGRYHGPHYGDTALHTSCDILTAKINAGGVVLWENIYRYDQKHSCQVGKRIIVDLHGNAFVTGSQSVRIGSNPFGSIDIVILAYDPFGHRIDSTYYNSPFNREDFGVNLVLDDDDDALYLYGWSQQADQFFDPVVVKYNTIYTSINPASFQHPFTIYPNPIADGKLFIQGDQEIKSIFIYDVMGRKMLSEQDFTGKSFIDLQTDFPSGLFIVSIQTADGVFAYPVVIR